jgi:hypothetical protein
MNNNLSPFEKYKNLKILQWLLPSLMIFMAFATLTNIFVYRENIQSIEDQAVVLHGTVFFMCLALALYLFFL